jgi:L-asparaginase/Glu-tRNA(Gln) amidotransferase subunit D
LVQHFALAKALAEAIDESLRLTEVSTAAMCQSKTKVAIAATGGAIGEEGAAEAKTRMAAAKRARAEE